MKKTVSLLLALIILFSVTMLGFTAQAASLPKSGSCGKYAKYTFNSSTGLLTISGKGMVKDFAFDKKTEIKSVVIKSGVEGIGDASFRACTNIESVTIPTGVRGLGNASFCNCKSLASISIPKTVEFIGDHAFENCTKLNSIKLPAGIIDVGTNVFTGTLYARNKDNWNGDYLIIDGYLMAFKNASLKGKSNVSLTIPKETVTIASYVFKSPAISTIRVPQGVKNVGGWTFLKCKNLKRVYLPDSIMYMGTTPFGSVKKNLDIYYAGTKSMSYKIRCYGYDNKKIKVFYGPNGLGRYSHYFRIHYAKSNKPAAPKITSVSGRKESVAVKWSKVKNVKGYQIQCATDKKFTKGKKTVKVSAKANTKRVAKLKANKVYYVRIRSYKIVNKKTVYSKWSAVKSAKTTK